MNSRLLNLSTILVAVVTVGVGVFIYNSAQSVVPDALDTITIQEGQKAYSFTVAS